MDTPGSGGCVSGVVVGTAGVGTSTRGAGFGADPLVSAVADGVSSMTSGLGTVVARITVSSLAGSEGSKPAPAGLGGFGDWLATTGGVVLETAGGAGILLGAGVETSSGAPLFKYFANKSFRGDLKM